MKAYSIIIFVILFCLNLFAQDKKNDTLFVASWNLENLFDTVNDSLKEDEEFLPGSVKD